MQEGWPRTVLVELVGVFGLVFFSSGVVCVNQLTTPAPRQLDSRADGYDAETVRQGTAPLTLHQPGLIGVALAQGTILAVLLVLTVPVTGGYLNPAVTVTLWAFGRVDSFRAGVLVGAQMLGSVLAATALRLVFDPAILQTARFGTPHVNALAYPILSTHSTLAGSGVELLLTFFLVFAMFGALGPTGDPAKPSLAAGMVQTAAVLLGYPLTGAALNPARWLGPVLWESVSAAGLAASPWKDFLVYLSGPILGALLAGLFCIRVAAPAPPAAPAGPGKKGTPTR
jgi:aquaporin TIP